MVYIEEDKQRKNYGILATIIISFASLFSPLSAVADKKSVANQDSGLYFIKSVGVNKFKSVANYKNSSNFHEFSLGIGYKIDENFSLELVGDYYFNFEEVKSFDFEGLEVKFNSKNKFDSATIRVKGTYPINETNSVFGRVGYGWTQISGELIKNISCIETNEKYVKRQKRIRPYRNSHYLLGVGVEHKFTDTVNGFIGVSYINLGYNRPNSTYDVDEPNVINLKRSYSLYNFNLGLEIVL